MQVGALFPQTEISGEAAAVRRWAEVVERTGYRHIVVYDHVLGADPTVHQGWSSPVDLTSPFHEPLVLFGFLAGVTGLELATGVMILPQRQTALVAKQAAEIDLLTHGRFRLGIGIGWNAVEYEALGKDFNTRGRRIEEQVGLLRRLWTEQSVTFAGAHEQVTGAGISPLPIQRPIPVWFGGMSERALRRAGRLADGWFPQCQPGVALGEARDLVEQAAITSGRDPAELGMEGTVIWAGEVGKLLDEAEAWRAAGATHLSVKTAKAGLRTLDDHLAALTLCADALGLVRPG